MEKTNVVPHYNMPIEPITYIQENKLNFIQGCVVKYISRYMSKGGIDDLKKIIHYCEIEIKRLQDIEEIKY
jgi:hypothetical protein